MTKGERRLFAKGEKETGLALYEVSIVRTYSQSGSLTSGSLRAREMGMCGTVDKWLQYSTLSQIKSVGSFGIASGSNTHINHSSYSTTFNLR